MLFLYFKLDSHSCSFTFISFLTSFVRNTHLLTGVWKVIGFDPQLLTGVWKVIGFDPQLLTGVWKVIGFDPVTDWSVESNWF